MAPCAALVAVLVLPACHAMRPNLGHVDAVTAGALAGAFRQENGRWPADLRELRDRPCPWVDADLGFPDAQIDEVAEAAVIAATRGCQFLARLPYQLEMRPRAANLLMIFRGADNRLVCKLVVVTPDTASGAHSPMVVMRTSIPGCPGQGEPLR
jgi:hypothetical protein